MRVLDLFSGIGGFSLGLERTGGFSTLAFCEKDPYCQRVLAKHWPGVPIHDDITELDGRQFRGAVDVVCGGFPCQDLSLAGAQAGIDGSRSGLWAELARIIGEVRPRYAIVENVPALLSGDRGRWFGRVLGDLAALGFDAEWHCIPASALGAPHRRDRVWVIAYPNGNAGPRPTRPSLVQRAILAETGREETLDRFSAMGEGENAVANGHSINGQDGGRLHSGVHRPAQTGREERLGGSCGGWASGFWDIEPGVGQLADGVRNRSHRLRALGNAVVPQVVTLLGEAILASEAA